MTTKTRKSSAAAPALREDTLYLAFDRFVCGRVKCAGQTAVHTGVTIGGAQVQALSAADVAAAQAEQDGAPLVCECGAVSVAFEALRPLAEIEADAERAGLMKKKRAPRTRTTKTPERALSVVPDVPVVTEPEPVNVAQKSAQRGLTCQWVACEKRATSVRSLAGQKWSVCSEHSA